MSSSSSSSSSGIGFLGVLTIVLVILKSLGYISLSWWWIFSPVILGVIVTIGFLALFIWAHTR